MSLKAIKDAVNELEAVLDHPNAPASVRETWEKAKAEISALEKAALTVSACGIAYPTQASGVSGAEWQDATMLFATIAKEAK